MRIAHITNPQQILPPKGDRGRWLLVTSLIEEQVKRGHDVTIFGNPKTSIKGATTIGLPLLDAKELAGSGTSDKMLKVYNTLLLLNKLYRHSNEYDIVHSHLDNLHFFQASLVNQPTVMTQHWPIEELTQQIIDRVPYSNVYITPISQAQVRHKAQKIQYTDVVYNGIDIDMFPFVETPQDHFVFVGRLHPTKGPHHAINAAQQLGAKLLIAGSTDMKREIYKNYWDEYISPALNGPLVEYRGELPHKDIPAFMGQAKAMLFPIEWEEPFGLVMVEAMACGTPVIAYNRGSAPELVQHGKTGFVVNNEEELAEAMQKIDTIKRADCRAWVEQQFTTERMAEGYDTVYTKLVAQHG